MPSWFNHSDYWTKMFKKIELQITDLIMITITIIWFQTPKQSKSLKIYMINLNHLSYQILPNSLFILESKIKNTTIPQFTFWISDTTFFYTIFDTCFCEVHFVMYFNDPNYLSFRFSPEVMSTKIIQIWNHMTVTVGLSV